MFDWLKKRELEQIESLQKAFAIRGETVDKLRDEVLFLQGKLDDAIKIANGKRIVECKNKRCIDWGNGTCCLDKVIIACNGNDTYCEECGENIADEMVNDNPILKLKFVDKTEKD